jgi:hypothetical protein
MSKDLKLEIKLARYLLDGKFSAQLQWLGVALADPYNALTRAVFGNL